MFKLWAIVLLSAGLVKFFYERERTKGTRTFSDFPQHRDGERRDVGSEPGQQLGDGHIEVGEIVTLETQSHREAPQSRAGHPGCLLETKAERVSGRFSSDRKEKARGD